MLEKRLVRRSSATPPRRLSALPLSLRPRRARDEHASVRLLGARARRRFLALVALALAATACGPRPDGSAAAYLEAVRSAESGLDEALAPFEDRTKTPRPEQARPLVEGAISARDRVEAIAVPEPLVSAWREELVYLNHVIPALGRFGASDGGPAALEELRSVLARGRAHQKRGRRSLPAF